MNNGEFCNIYINGDGKMVEIPDDEVESCLNIGWHVIKVTRDARGQVAVYNVGEDKKVCEF